MMEDMKAGDRVMPAIGEFRWTMFEERAGTVCQIWPHRGIYGRTKLARVLWDGRKSTTTIPVKYLRVVSERERGTVSTGERQSRRAPTTK